MRQTAIQPTRDEDYAEWYQQVVKAAELAEPSPVRGCMVIKPWGYAIWENIQKHLDRMFKETGHQNAYFPLFIPLEFLRREAQHVEGFAKECAVVTHHRLEVNEDGELVPAAPLEEPLIVRPTSETIIGEMFSRWVQSYRDLPLLINQWANVVRWEMRTRMFLRTTEFLWQEGHTAHATAAEAQEEALRMLDVYERFARDFMAMPVVKGEKTERERFPGAVRTYTIEAMMQDRRALQAGTSHFLGQNFARASNIRFLDRSGKLEYAWTTSWGVSTRLVGGLVMTHSDDDGLVLPPVLAPRQVVILPVIHKQEVAVKVNEACDRLASELRQRRYGGEALRVEVDRRDLRGGEKMWSWVKKGVPLRVEIGPRDLEKGVVTVYRRDRSPREKEVVGRGEFLSRIESVLDEIQERIWDRAHAFLRENTVTVSTRDELKEFFGDPGQAGQRQGGFALCWWNGSAEDEERLQEELGVTVRCILFDQEGEGPCLMTGRSAQHRVIIARAY
ncbi:MAG: proline--tRNA ligase [Verrucomicrobia bacterium]|nr:MAG: proline--tRNA ligase [Verrucomicrobiota bacterium]